MTPARSSADAAATQPVEGLVERVTFHSQESGFCVLKIKARGFRDLVAVVGTVARINAGEWVVARGQWQMDPQHGRQFRAEVIEVHTPDSIEGIEKFLGSGLIKGIGPHYAAKLVQAFGRGVFDIIENRSAMLEQVEGIGPVRRAKIKASWNEQKTVREIMTFLFSHGVSTARAFRIYKTYGEQAIEKVRLDPYCLARDIHGIGFKSADTIAQHMGISRESPLRARAGLSYVLLQLSEQGHCAYPRAELIETAVRLLEIPAAVVEEALKYEVEQRQLVVGKGENDELWVWLASLDAAERELAARLATLRAGPHPCPAFDAAAAEHWVQRELKIELAEGQRAALREAFRAKVMVITGGPGVGKTTLVRSLVRVFHAKLQEVLLCAPTGRAAKRLAEVTGREAKTIHRLLAYDPGHGKFRFNLRDPLKGDVFIVDETSMIDLPLAVHLLRAIPNRGALIFVGDVDQLPSVGPGSVLRDIIDSGVVPVCRLTHIFRQASESLIVTNAHRVNAGQMPVGIEKVPPTEALRDFYFIEAGEPAKVVEVIVKLLKESIPRRFRFNPVQDVQILAPMLKGEVGARNLNRVVQAALNPTGPAADRFGWLYRQGDRVIQTENDYDKDVFNGDIGRISRVDEDNRELTVLYDGREVAYDFDELDELLPAYAITVHKSQGSEYPCVIMPVHTQHFIMLQRNLLYTGLTRGKKLVILVGSTKALALAVKKAEAARRFTALRQRLLESIAVKP